MMGTRTQEWAERARAHLLGSDGVVGGTAEVIFEKGEGIILTDVEGKDRDVQEEDRHSTSH